MRGDTENQGLEQGHPTFHPTAEAEETPDAAADRRTHARSEIQLQVEYESVEDFLMDYTSNVSIGGMFIRTPEPAEVGTKFRMRFRIPTRETPITANGEVRWVVPGNLGEHVHSGMGIRFTDLTAEDHASIQEMLKLWADD